MTSEDHIDFNRNPNPPILPTAQNDDWVQGASPTNGLAKTLTDAGSSQYSLGGVGGTVRRRGFGGVFTRRHLRNDDGLYQAEIEPVLKRYSLRLFEASNRRDWYDSFSVLRDILIWVFGIILLVGGIFGLLALAPQSDHVQGNYTVNVCNIMVSKNFTNGPIGDLRELSCWQFLGTPAGKSFTNVLTVPNGVFGAGAIYYAMPLINSLMWILALWVNIIATTQLSGVLRILVEPGTGTAGFSAAVPLAAKAAIIEFCEHGMLIFHAPFALVVVGIWKHILGSTAIRLILYMLVGIYLQISTMLLGSNWFDSVNMGSVRDDTGNEVLFCAWYRQTTYAWLCIIHAILCLSVFFFSTRVYGVDGGQVESSIWLVGASRGLTDSSRHILNGLCDFANFSFRVRRAVSPLIVKLVDTKPQSQVGHLAYEVVDANDYKPGEGGLINERRVYL